nr:hypothetical protein Iba_chr04cCG1570 [Ipomoea batatas]
MIFGPTQLTYPKSQLENPTRKLVGLTSIANRSTSGLPLHFGLSFHHFVCKTVKTPKRFHQLLHSSAQEFPPLSLKTKHQFRKLQFQGSVKVLCFA